MNKENNRSAAGLRRSAIAERIRLRNEWSALKGTDVQPVTNIQKKHNAVLKKQVDNVKATKNDKCKNNSTGTKVGMENSRFARAMAATNEVLRGVVALVEVGAENKGLALRAALCALGASVVPTWSPHVTHLIWSRGGCRNTRAKARALACRLVSPLWVEACASSGKRLLETKFPAAPRPSDIPSPKTLQRLLKKAERENISLEDLLRDSKEEEKQLKNPLRMSSETEHDTTADTTADSENSDKDNNATTPTRHAPPAVVSSPTKSRRKLFAMKEVDVSKSSSNETDEGRSPLRKQLTQHDLRGLAHAERMARRLVCPRAPHAHTAATDTHTYRVVLTGVSRSERIALYSAIRSLGGRVQNQVNRKTTHVLIGSCREDCVSPGVEKTKRNTPIKVNSGVSLMNFNDDVTASGLAGSVNKMADVDKMASGGRKLRTVKALLGAARGCRVLFAKWATDSVAAKRWLHHFGYEVPHLRKISQKARVERQALGRMHREYAYDVFNGIHVRISPNAEQRDAVVQLLSLCGAIIQDGGGIQNGANAQNGGLTQNGRQTDTDITIGTGENEVNSKWVFDSVSAARMRTLRKYVNKEI